MDQQTEMHMLGMLQTMAEAAFVKRIRSRFVVMDVDIPNPKFIRVGRPYDGGYIMLDDFDGIKIAYSGGINRDVSWDEDMAERGLDIFMYDHTIDGLPKEHPKFHWFKKGLIGKPDPNYPDLETLSTLVEQNGHGDDYNMILKMDIEGAEYGIFQQIDIDTIRRFKQIVLEFHALTTIDYEEFIGMALDKLNATHQLVHVHANNYSKHIVRGGLVLPATIEGTYLRRSDYKFVKSQKFYPTPLDMPNKATRPDINLGYWG